MQAGLDILHSVDGGKLTEQTDICKLMIQTAVASRVAIPDFTFDEGALQTVPVPVTVAHENLVVKCHAIRYESSDGHSRYNIAVEISMPCGESSLIWMPWLPHQIQPERSPGEYRHISFQRMILMPRKTKCYGYAYAFSGQTHPVEAETPPAISGLYAETSSIFRLGEYGPNMCLENDYDNGREYISEHSDDEKQFGQLHDVYCWITGSASRMGVFRVKKLKNSVPSSLHRYCCDSDNPESSRDLFSINIPAGFYVMRGRRFQERYSHEFPQVHPSLLKRILAFAPTLWSGVFPEEVPDSDKGAPRAPVVQAEWLKEHREQVHEAAINGKLSKKKRSRLDNESDATAFDEWCEARTSYTLRQFDVKKTKK